MMHALTGFCRADLAGFLIFLLLDSILLSNLIVTSNMSFKLISFDY